METEDPAVVYTMLDSINTEELNTRRLRAHYALLYSQALDKNGQKLHRPGHRQHHPPGRQVLQASRQRGGQAQDALLPRKDKEKRRRQ